MQNVVFVFFTSFIIFLVAERICERQKTCQKCDSKGRYSYYSCDSDDDCFKEESCREGFCCPKINATFFEDPTNRAFSSSFFDESAISLSACPDGSSWMRMCKTDIDCLFDDEICAHGKCCSNCISRRRQLLREHSPQTLAGIHIPQCSEDGRFYQMKQCIQGFPRECFCSSLYGERVNPVAIDESGILCGNSIQPETQIPFIDPRMQQQTPNRYLSIEKGAFHEFNPSTNCLDPLKEFRPCRTACQVTCNTRIRPICPFAGRCNPGCQCRMPYILVSSDDLENSKCVLPAECPMNSLPVPTPGRIVYKSPILPFNAEENSDATLFRQFPHGAIGVGIDRSKQMHCSDPLKNFLTCGTSCPAACDRLNPVCSFQCVSGCFCRTPYVLSDMNDANSACILPQHCEIHPKKNPFESEPTFGKDDDKGFILQTTTINSEELNMTTTPSELSTTMTSEVTSTMSAESSTLPPIKCADSNKEFLNCATSCPLACDNLNAQICSPCVAGCFCKNGLVFESVKNWTNARCVRIDQCSRPETTTISSSMDDSEKETIGTKLFTIRGHVEIGTFVFSTSMDQKIRFDAKIDYLPYTESKTFVLTIHKYGSISTDFECESIGEVMEINPVYTYPFPNGTLLYLKDITVPYSASYTFQASSEFATRSVGAVIGRSIALHAIFGQESAKIGPPLGCATIGILKG